MAENYSILPSVISGSGQKMSYPCIVVGSHTALSYSQNQSALSSAFQAGTTIVRISATTDCYLSFGQSPTADTNDMFLPANKPEVFGVLPGWKVSVFASAGPGKLSIAEGKTN